MILDSNIVIYSIKPNYTVLRLFLQLNQHLVHVSYISKLEVLGYHQISPDDKQKFETYFQTVPIYPVRRTIIDEAVRLRQQRKRSVGDAIIAATALLYNQPLLTNNEADFADIEGLQLIPLQSLPF